MLKMCRWVALRGLVALLAMSFLVVGSAPRAFAANSCKNYTSWLYGAYFPPQQTYIAGAQAQIDVRRNDGCSGTPSDGHERRGSAWAMLAQFGVGTGRLAQVGWIRRSSCGCLRYFSEYVKNTGPPTILYFGTPSNGDSKVFKVTWKDGSGEDNHIHMIMCDAGGFGGTNCVDHTPTGLDWNPVSAGWTSSSGIWSGETHDPSSDMPGTSGTHATFHWNTVLVRNQGNAWFVPDSLTECTNSSALGTCSDTNNRYNFAWTPSSGQEGFDIWTDPL